MKCRYSLICACNVPASSCLSGVCTWATTSGKSLKCLRAWASTLSKSCQKLKQLGASDLLTRSTSLSKSFLGRSRFRERSTFSRVRASSASSISRLDSNAQRPVSHQPARSRSSGWTTLMQPVSSFTHGSPKHFTMPILVVICLSLESGSRAWLVTIGQSVAARSMSVSARRRKRVMAFSSSSSAKRSGTRQNEDCTVWPSFRYWRRSPCIVEPCAKLALGSSQKASVCKCLRRTLVNR
mmetsp:Transcript_76552/g.212617  ORF Transcript_76552/g.212617 Transcript_76552/m.212617 type:complete len:239 (-) Transcript_76552:1688-2404(-)